MCSLALCTSLLRLCRFSTFRDQSFIHGHIALAIKCTLWYIECLAHKSIVLSPNIKICTEFVMSHLRCFGRLAEVNSTDLRRHLPFNSGVKQSYTELCRTTVMSLIIWATHPNTPFFPGNMLYPSIWTTTFEFFSNIRTPTPCGAWMGVAKPLLAFNSLRSYSEGYQTSSSIL